VVTWGEVDSGYGRSAIKQIGRTVLAQCTRCPPTGCTSHQRIPPVSIALVSVRFENILTYYCIALVQIFNSIFDSIVPIQLVAVVTGKSNQSPGSHATRTCLPVLWQVYDCVEHCKDCAEQIHAIKLRIRPVSAVGARWHAITCTAKHQGLGQSTRI
jgi:hypothetical protein